MSTTDPICVGADARVVLLSDQDLYDQWIATSPEFGCADPVGFARAVLARWGTANSAQISSSLAVIQAIREEVLHIDPNDLNSDQINLVLSIIDNHLP